MLEQQELVVLVGQIIVVQRLLLQLLVLVELRVPVAQATPVV
jgi:hypothetical protein